MKQTAQFLGSGVFSPLRKCLPHFRKAGLAAALLMLSASGMRAADSPGVKFNASVRYSQWAIDSRTHDFMLNNSKFGLATYDASGNKLAERTDDKKKLDYVGGLVSKAVIEAADYYEDYDWSKPWFYSVKEYGDNYKSSSKLSAGTAFDDMNGAKLYIGIYNNSNATDEDKTNATSALSLIKTGFTTANKSYVIASGTLAEQQGNSVAGGWWHKSTYKNQMWCDGAYMGSALLAQLTAHYGTADNVFGSKSADWDMVFKQLNIVWNMCWNSTDKLMYHGFDATASAGWAGLSKTAPYVFHSAAYWGRANAWYLMSLVDVLEAMKKDGQSNTDNYTTLKSHLADLAAGVAAQQDATTGGWYQIMNLDNSFTSAKGNANYIETSATSIFSAALFKAVRLGLLDSSYKTVAENAFMGLVDNFVSYNNGKIQIWGSSKSAGLDSSRKGDNDYYLDGDDVVMVKEGETTEGKVLGGFIMAATEYERACQGQDSKRVLFAYDLAPEYDFSTTAGSIKAEAYGKGTVTYEWFKSEDGSSTGTGVSGATSDTFTPAEDGYYFCSAKDESGATAQTRTTYVKANKSTAGGDDTPTTSTTIFSYTMPTSGSASTTDIDATVGKISFSGSSFEANGFRFGGSTVYVKVTPTSALQVGDVITFTSYAAKADMGIKAKAAADNANAVTLGTGSTASQDYTGSYTVTAADVLNGATSIYLYRSGGSTTYLKSVKITRAGSSEPTTTQYTVTASAQLDGTVKIKSGDKEIESGSKVDKGTALTFTASLPSQGTSMYDFEGWTVNNKDIEGTDKTYTVASLESDINVVARIKRARANVYILASSYGTTTATHNGTALKNGALVDLGSKVVFTATPESGYKFSCWEIKGDGDTELSGSFTDNPYTVTIDHDYSMKAKFEKKGETPVTANSTFGLDDLSLLATSPSGNQKSSLTDGYITITATKGITANTNNDGLKVSSSTTFTIGTANNAKISKITVEQSATNRECTYSPTYSERTADASSKTFVYTYTDNKPSQITVTGPSSSMKITSIVVEYETSASKTDLTASFASADVEAKVGDAAVDLPALTVKAGDKTLALTADYTVTYKSNDENVAKVADGKVVFVGKGNTTIDAAITPLNSSLYNSTTASFNVNVTEKTTPVDPTQESVVYDFKTAVGTTTGGKNCTVSTDNIKFGSDFRAAEGKYITIDPSVSGGFKAGDVITLHGVCDSKNKSGVVIYSDVNAESSIFKTNAFATTANGGSDYTFTLTEDCDNLYFGRFGGGTAYITALTVKRPAATGKTRLSAAFATASSVVANTTQTVLLPALTIKAGDKELSNEEYTVEYASNATDVATISGNVVTVVGTGTATITATITPNDADTYVGTTATYQLTVKEPTALNITIPDVTMNVTDANYKQPEIKVYGDDDRLLTLGTDYTLTYKVESGSNVTVDNDGVFKPAGEQYKWTEGQTVFTVTATPATELGNTYTAGKLQFAYSVVTGKATPTFMAGFANGNIKLHKDENKRYFTVPLIYNHEDVSDDFDYTYSIAGAAQTITNTHTMEYMPSAEGTFEVTVSAKAKVLYPNDEDKKVDYGEVYNDPDPLTFTLDVKEAYDRISVTLDPAKVDLYTGTTESAPDVTVTKHGTDDVLDDSKYTLRWIVNNDAYARVNATTGRIEGVEEGSVKGRCSVTGDNIESTTAFFDINVDDPARYRAKDVDNDKNKVIYGNQAPLWNQNKDFLVVLGGWMFPQDVTSGRDLVSDEGLKSSYKWSDYAGQAKWRLSGFAYMVDGDAQRNARQENAANAMAQSTTLYDADFKNVGSIKDQMFGVPCSGSYLVFNPKTAGVVTAHIFQNGVFDKKGKKYQYRPQRRVFVMDEAGNVVSAEAEIENTNGKPTGGIYDLSSYKWDINNDAAPTADEVNSHFKGLTDFNMNATDGASSFKNNVYESAFGPSGSLVVNPAADDNVKGSYGWSVLADSPVTYSFRVQPGKTYYLYNYGSKIGFYGFSFEEDETKPVVDQLEFYANQTNEIKPTEAGHVAQVKINRKLKADQWTSVVLPFSLNKPQVDAIFGETYSASKPDGTQILYFDRIEGSKAIFVRHAYNTIVAGKPFIIKPTKDVECINTADCAEFPYVTIESEKPAEWCKGDGYAWVSSYSNDMTVKTGDCFISNRGTFMNYEDNPATLNGFRGYLKRTDYGVQEVKQLRAATGSNVADDSTSAIDGVYLDSDAKAAVETIADGKVYNMSGQVVATSAAALKTLPSGVYMLNGKKIVK